LLRIHYLLFPSTSFAVAGRRSYDLPPTLTPASELVNESLFRIERTRAPGDWRPAIVRLIALTSCFIG
jgi:hypothetical protein